MVSGAAAVTLAVMVLVGLATAGFLAYMVRDLVETLSGGADERSTRVALVGPVVYLVGFCLVLAGTLLGDGGALVGVGIGVIVLAGVPMGAGLYLAHRGAGR